MLAAPTDHHGVPLRGREAELGRLRAALARTDAGEPTVLVVTGPPGVGKTRLIADAIAGGERMILRATGDAAEADLEYGIVEQLLRGVPRALAGAAPAPPARAAEPLRVGAGLLAMIDALDLERPLVVAVDDAQWAALASLQALAFAARRLRADPVALLVGCRDEGVERLPAGRLRVVDASAGRIALEGLDRAAVAELARERLGRPLSDAAARRLTEHTSGVPQHLLALLAELSHGHRADRRPGRAADARRGARAPPARGAGAPGRRHDDRLRARPRRGERRGEPVHGQVRGAP